jgi:hypothetical protein
MHAVLSRRPTSAPLEDLYSLRRPNRLDVSDHLRRHIRIRFTESHIFSAFILRRFVGEPDLTVAGMIVEWIGSPVDVERDAEGVEAETGSTGDLAAVVTVCVLSAYVIAMMEHDCRQRLPGLCRRRRNADPVRPEGDQNQGAFVALEFPPKLAELCGSF